MPSTTSAPKQQHKPQIAAASVDEIRAHFPALERKHNGQPVAYFDGPGGTQVPRSVVEAVADYLYHHNANTHWNYPDQRRNRRDADRCPRRRWPIFSAVHPTRLSSAPTPRRSAFHVSRALGRQFSADDEIVITELDHHANVGPWQALAKERGCTLRVVKMDTASGALDWSDFEQKVNAQDQARSRSAPRRTRSGRSPMFGEPPGLPGRSVRSCLWTPSTTRRTNLADVRAMDCDFLVCSAYKFYGPHIGALWCRRELLESLPFAKVQPAPDSGPESRRDGHAQPRGHRRRGRGRRFPGVARERAARVAQQLSSCDGSDARALRGAHPADVERPCGDSTA